ncbi:MAG: Tad domain-containing protein [Pseudomonadota bacterium]|nr:Tad domain-containing protein [Pseudomonadota bacterium]
MIKQAFKRLWNDRRGNVIAIAGAALPIIVGAAGLATDTIQWTLWKRQLQRAADSAAIAGVYNRESENNASTYAELAVRHDLTLNRHMHMALLGDPVVTFPDNEGVMRNQVHVVIKVQQSLPFSAMFMTSVPEITATARAASIPAGGDACMEALETGTETGITFSGNATIDMPDCDLFSNASGANTSISKGSAKVYANSVGGVGGIKESNNFFVGSYRPYSPALPNPFKNVKPDPDEMECGTGSIALSPSTDFSTLGGVNCFSSLSVGSNTSMTVPDNFGPIYVNGGDATIQGTFNCKGCTIVLTNKSASNPIGNLKSNGNPDSKINITAPLSGTFKGIAIYQDPRASDCNNCNKLNGNSSSIVTGALYFPSRELEYNGSGTTSATCTMFVARRLNFSGNSSTSNKFKKLSDCSAFGLPSSATTRMVRLVK